MIETLMALWNRGVGGRLMVMAITFLSVCISISLLFVTVGGAWGSLFAHGRTGGEERRVVNAALITATAPTSVITVPASPVEATPTMQPNPCLLSPTGSHRYTPAVDGTRDGARTSIPTARVSATPAHQQKTPLPGVTATPEPTPSPTASPGLPAVTPTVAVTPTATTLPTVTPTVISTPTVTLTITPTVSITPTDITTPGATPSLTPTVPGSTPTSGVAPTATATPNVTPPIIATPAGSPAVMKSATTGIGSRHTHDGGSLTPVVLEGTPATVNNGRAGQGSCLSDNLVVGEEGGALSLLQNFFWIIVVSSLLGTMLFCAQMYRMSRNFHL